MVTTSNPAGAFSLVKFGAEEGIAIALTFAAWSVFGLDYGVWTDALSLGVNAFSIIADCFAGASLAGSGEGGLAEVGAVSLGLDIGADSVGLYDDSTSLASVLG